MSNGFFSTRRVVLGTLVMFTSAASAVFAQGPVVSSHIPTIVKNGRAQLVSPMAKAQTLRLALNLPLRNEAELDTLLADLYNPKSPNFRHWLSQPEFEARFGPTDADKKTLVQWAKDKGLTIAYEAPNGRIIEVEGLVDTVNSAFHVQVQTYHDPVLNRDFHAPDREPTTDMKIALLSVDGLENSEPKVNHHQKDPRLSLPASIAAARVSTLETGEITGVTSTTSQPKIPHVYGSGPSNAYLPTDMRAAYYGNGNLTGQGQTVGIFSFDGYVASDLPFYYSSTGFSSTVPVTNVLTGGFNGACTSPCDDGEQILDIVNVQGMAPGLTSIRFYENGTTANTELNIMVTDNLAKTISNSWGGGGFGTSSDTYFKQMATQGQSYLSATGDDGAFYRSNYSAPSLDPYITQVGGTEMVVTGPGGSYVSEYAWDGSAGGYWITGISTSGKYTIPTWQTAAVNSSNAASATYRNVPDVAAEADYDNPTVSNGALEIGYGGTSFATPRYAGYIALANQQYAENGGSSLGFLNPSLYTAGLSSSYNSIYHDVTAGTDPAYPAGTPIYTAVTGYDIVTGWGSPNGAGLINYLAGAPVADFAPTTTGVTVQTYGPSVTANIPLTVYNGFTGTVSLTVANTPNNIGISTTAGTPGTPPTITVYATSAPLGTYIATVTATSTYTTSTGSAGVLTHTINFPITVEKRANADFSLSATTASVNQASSGTSTVTINSGTGLNGPVSLAVSGLAPGLSATLSSTMTTVDTPTQTVTLTVTSAGYVPVNSYTAVVTGTSSAGIVHSVTVPVTVVAPPSLLVDGGFESGGGSGAGWTTSGVSYLTTMSTIPPHTGTYFVLLDGGSAAETSTVSQKVTITAGTSKATLGLWFWVLTSETGTTAKDVMSIQVTDASGNVTTLGTVSNLTQNGYWGYLSYDVSQFIGQTVTIGFKGVQAGTTGTDFLLDDVSLVAQ